MYGLMAPVKNRHPFLALDPGGVVDGACWEKVTWLLWPKDKTYGAFSIGA